MSYRFRVNEEGALVLQVLEKSERHFYGYEGTATWRDAKVSDIPVRDPFATERGASGIDLRPFAE